MTSQGHKDKLLNLSPTSSKVLELKETILEEWEKSVREAIPQTKNLLHPILLDTIPGFLDQIAKSISYEYPGINALDSASVPAEHGGERARLTDFDHQALINEYYIFRSTIFNVLYEKGVKLSHHEALIINAWIDMGVRESVNAFFLVHSAFREQFIAGLTHDLRDPLSTAKLAIELIMKIDDPAKMKNYATKVSEHLNRMNGMVSQLLDSMMFEKGQNQPLNLTNFDIMDLVRNVQLHSSSVHGQRFQISGYSIKGWWDLEAIRRALENMIGNAIKYGDEHKLITINVEEMHERLMLSIHNNGQPIPPDEQESIFQIFRRASAAHEQKKQGWGIGLPFVRSVAERHGGSVMVESALEKGTTFLFDIPVDARPFQHAPTLS